MSYRWVVLGLSKPLFEVIDEHAVIIMNVHIAYVKCK